VECVARPIRKQEREKERKRVCFGFYPVAFFSEDRSESANVMMTQEETKGNKIKIKGDHCRLAALHNLSSIYFSRLNPEILFSRLKMYGKLVHTTLKL
jgi:hypothetical protein